MIPVFEILDKIEHPIEDHGELRTVQLTEDDVKALRAALNATIVIQTPPLPESELITHLSTMLMDLERECARMRQGINRARRIENLLNICKAVLIEQHAERHKSLIDAIIEEQGR